MSAVYLAIPHAPDRRLGHIEADGRVLRSQAGPDDVIGQVDLGSGIIYEQRVGPDKKVGYVDLSSGKVYRSRPGPDQRIGQVTPDGSLYRHVPLGADDYVGKVEQFVSYAHSGAALLLLALPAYKEVHDQKDEGTK